ncbi:hypothetical protein OROMI_032686 [Orobanche minor]
MDAADIDLFVTFLWSIWYHRNFVVHGKKEWEAVDFVAQVHHMIGGLKRQLSGSPAGSNHDDVVEWSPPPTDFVKVNVDAAVKTGEAWTRGGIVARDSEGNFLAWRHVRMRTSCSPEVAEAWVLAEGVKFAAGFGWPMVVVESDCSNVVSAFNSKGHCFSDAGVFVDEARRRSLGFAEIRVVHVRRTGNTTAHKIASHFDISCSGLGPPPLED